MFFLIFPCNVSFLKKNIFLFSNLNFCFKKSIKRIYSILKSPHSSFFRNTSLYKKPHYHPKVAIKGLVLLYFLIFPCNVSFLKKNIFLFSNLNFCFKKSKKRIYSILKSPHSSFYVTPASLNNHITTQKWL